MPPKPPVPQRFRLTASAIAAHTKHRCDRLFRWRTVPAQARGLTGIGWNVPKRERAASRPAIRLLMTGGDEFELAQVRDLIDVVGEDQFVTAGEVTEKGRTQIAELPLDEFVTTLQRDALPKFIAQVAIDLADDPASETMFLALFGLDAAVVQASPARPDLIEIIPPQHDNAPALLRIWDFKASQTARHEHFIQVAYYSLLLEHILVQRGLTHVQVDTETAVIRTRNDDEEFELAPYRLAVIDFLQNRMMSVLQTPAKDAHFHVCSGCMTCEYADHCRAEADAGSDLSRIPYISSESKRKLKQAGILSHRDLARLAGRPDAQAQVDALRALSQDLAVNTPRYVALAQALDDGRVRPLENTTLLMPRYDDVRIVISVEQDGVTGTCFALGMRVYEGFDATTQQILGSEHVFVAEQPDSEAGLLLAFLTELNKILIRIDHDNQTIAATPVTGQPNYIAAQGVVEQTQATLDAFKARYPILRKTMAQYDELNTQREELKQAAKQAVKQLKQVEKDLKWELGIKPQKRLHFYLYDTLDVFALRRLIERHIFDTEPPELLTELATLIRLFPPESVLADADTYRTVPGTVVVNVLRALVALPVPYTYDLQWVSSTFQPLDPTGVENGYVYRPRYGFGWESTNQVAFERIHDVWQGKTIDTPGKPGSQMTPAEITEEIRRTVLGKLRATDSIIRRLKQEFGDRLLLRKEPFRLHASFDPLNVQALEALRVFTILEAALDELQIKATHTLSLGDRAAKLACVKGLRYEGVDAEHADHLWFSFDPATRDAKFEPGDFNLVLTPEDDPMTLLGKVDGPLFQASRKHDPYKVSLIAYDVTQTPPRVCLRPERLDKFQEVFGDLEGTYVLDHLYIDYNSKKVLKVLQELRDTPEQATHVADIVATAGIRDWRPLVPADDRSAVEQELVHLAETAGTARGAILNAAQWSAWRGVFEEPLTLVWGPPGTGKTYTLAHMLLGYVLAARHSGRPFRVLVTAFTHHAITNVVNKLAELAEQYGIPQDDLTVAKILATGTHPADEKLHQRINKIGDGAIRGLVESAAPCVVVGGTVWSAYRSTNNEFGTPIQPLFDVILVDEASQMKLPDALLAFGVSKPAANFILAGDDEQLPPIIHGVYPEEHEPMLSSIFAFVRHRIQERKTNGDATVEDRLLFQLEENFRMNEPLTAYARDILYRGRYISTKPGIRIQTTPELEVETDDVIDFLLHPDRPVVLVRYAAPRSYTARNPVEAELIVRLIERLNAILLDPKTARLYEPNAFAEEGLGVLSPHRAQNSTIRQALRDAGYDVPTRPLPVVDTVDKLQGQERDVIFVSYGVADEEYAEGEAEFLLSKNRFNVATTRARHKLIVLCSEAVLNVVPTDRQVLVDAMMLKEFRRYCNTGLRQFTWGSQEEGDILLDVQWKGFPV
ncbi:MAG: AAA domain-containing protein [Chloroflexota bacterium]|nr:AAA domain-containing protein [Chloroflexota bacterium]